MSNAPENFEELKKIPISGPEELISLIRDPRYRSPHYPNRYVEMVEARIAISEGIGTDQTRSLGVEHSVTIGTGALTGESPAEDQQSIEQAYAESRPDSPMAVDINKIK